MTAKHVNRNSAGLFRCGLLAVALSFEFLDAVLCSTQRAVAESEFVEHDSRAGDLRRFSFGPRPGGMVAPQERFE